MKVRANCRYRYNPVPLDLICPPVGVSQGNLKSGDTVTVRNLPGCPRANTMGHCHIVNESGELLGLVCTNSLVSVK